MPTSTKPDPLAGYRTLARQVAQAGIRRVTGDVAIKPAPAGAAAAVARIAKHPAMA